MNSKKIGSTVLCILIVGLCLLNSIACAGNTHPNIGFILADDAGNVLLSQNADRQFTPASILKLLTSLAALRTFGESYHFTTSYVFDPDSKNLHIKGYGDPLLISEEIDRFCNHIFSTIQTTQIHHIILDHHYFSNQVNIPGKGNSLNPYDAPVGALCANFNTIMFEWSASEKKFVSGEPQTPLLPDFQDEIRRTHLGKGRIVLSDQQSRLYPGLLIRYFLNIKGIQTTGDILEGTIDKKNLKENIYTSSFMMTDIIRKLLKYSNNFIANQMMLSVSAHEYGPPATLEKGVKALRSFAERDLKLIGLTINEGSGLSHSNKISPAQMLKILHAFMPYSSLLNQNENDYFKTGTLTDVRTRAGYISGGNKKLYPYVIMVNQEKTGYETIHKKMVQKVLDITKK